MKHSSFTRMSEASFPGTVSELLLGRKGDKRHLSKLSSRNRMAEEMSYSAHSFTLSKKKVRKKKSLVYKKVV